MAKIDIMNLTFCYDGSYDNVFENISFRLDTDWRLGLTGRNGRGKTTLFQLMIGKYEYSGSIISSETFDYFPFQVPDMSLDTIDVVRQATSDFELWELNRELSMLELSEDILYRPFHTLSNGERTKALLGALFLKENHFLLIDEPTNHLDQRGRQTVSEYLKSKKGFFLVSHDRAFLDHCVDHIVAINREGIDVQKGNFSSWWEQRELKEQFEYAENERLKKDIKRLDEAAKRSAAWSDKVEATKIGTHAYDRGAIGHKAAKMMKRSKATEARQLKAVDDKSSLLKNIEYANDLLIKPAVYHAETLITIEDLAIAYDDRRVCENVSFTVKRGERIVLQGKNGSGKTSILKLLIGEQIVYTGLLQIGSNLKISYLSQDTSFLTGDLRSFARKHDVDESLLKAVLRQLDFARSQFDKNMEDFSEGQKKKVLIAKSLCDRAHLYIWDEPLNFIDVFSRMQIESLLIAYQPTMIFVEHDAVFSKTIATKDILL